jgi:tRNA-intron endonuclease
MGLENGKPVAHLKETRAVVWDSEEASKIFALGFYGKPVGIAKPKSSEFDVPLILDLVEAAYLMGKGYIDVYDPVEDRLIDLGDFRQYAKRTNNMFEEKLLIYRDLRDAGYVVTSGMKFGSTFAVYKRGPGIDHAPFVVDVLGLRDRIDSTEIVRAGRLATTVRKRFIVAVPNLGTGNIDYLLFKWWRA